MKDLSDVCGDANDKSICNSRREFLVKTTATAGGLVLALSGWPTAAEGQENPTSAKSITAPAAAPSSDEAVIKLDEKSPLSKVGGFDTIETGAGKVVIVRTGETDFKAYSAVCTHKGGPIKYDEKTQQLFCPWHNSRFDTEGKVVKGPAKLALSSYSTEKAVVVALKNKN